MKNFKEWLNEGTKYKDELKKKYLSQFISTIDTYIQGLLNKKEPFDIELKKSMGGSKASIKGFILSRIDKIMEEFSKKINVEIDSNIIKSFKDDIRKHIVNKYDKDELNTIIKLK